MDPANTQTNKETPTVNTPTNSKRIIIFFAIALAILLVVLAFALLNSNNPLPQQQNNSQNTDSNDDMTGQTETVFTTDDEWFDGETYPSELTSLRKSNTYSVNCGDVYDKLIMPISYANMDSEVLTDLDSLKAISTINDYAETDVNLIKKCIVTGAPEVSEYYLYNYCNESCGGGGGYNGVLVYAPDKTYNYTEWENNTAAYSRCMETLALSKESLLYINCSGGDGGGSGSEIYEIDLKNQKAVSIAKETATNEM